MVYLQPPFGQSDGTIAYPAEGTDGDERLRWALRQLREQNLVEEGDYVVLAHGWKTGVESLATYRVLAVGDLGDSLGS